MLHRLVTFFSIYRSLLGDKRTPNRTKILPLVALMYAVFPMDLVPDFLPLLGQMDDLTIIVLFIWMAMNAVSKPLYEEHVKKMHNNVIDLTPKD